MTKKAANRKQNYLIFLCWLVYTTAYLGRYSYNANIGPVMDAYGVTKADAGLVTTCFFFAYGVGQVLNGFMAKRYSKRWIFPIVLIASAAINFAVYMGVPFETVKYLWLLNGLCQSCLWPSLVSTIGDNLDGVHANRSVLAMSTTTSCGTLIVYGLSALFVQFLSYKVAFLFSSITLVAVAVVWLLSFRSLGLVHAEAETEETEEFEECEEDEPESSAKKKVGLSLTILFILLGVFAVIDNLTKDGLHTWVPVILKDTYALPDSFSILLTLALPIFGIFGAFFAVWLNRYIKNPVVMCSLFCASSAICIAGIIWSESLWLTLLLFSLVVLLMHSVNNVITMITPIYMRDKIDAGRISGILNGCCYLGSTISTYGLGLIADHAGWNGVFYVMLGCVCFGIAIGGVYLLYRKIKYEKRLLEE